MRRSLLAIIARCGVVAVASTGCEDARLVAEAPGPQIGGCSATATDDLVALFRFEEPAGSSAYLDPIGGHSARANAPGLRAVAGPAGCGQAIRFPEKGQPHAYLVVDPSPAFELASGAIDFWLWLPRPTADEFRVGILSRDARLEQTPGHLTVYWLGPGHLVVRLQGENERGSRCSATVVPQERWLHVGINFGGGPLELFIDGVVQDGRIDPLFVPSAPCGTETTDGLVGNQNPWVLGANADGSPEGTAIDLKAFAFSVALDELRIGRMRQNFALQR